MSTGNRCEPRLLLSTPQPGRLALFAANLLLPRADDFLALGLTVFRPPKGP